MEMDAQTVEAAVSETEPVVEETANENGRARTQFQKGNPGGPGRSRKGEGQGQPKPARLLRDMRAVYGQDESTDRGPGQKLCRKVLTENPKEFLSQLAGLEKAHQAREKERKAATPAVPEKP